MLGWKSWFVRCEVWQSLNIFKGEMEGGSCDWLRTIGRVFSQHVFATMLCLVVKCLVYASLSGVVII
jgi:hypothetical protein